MTRTTHGLTTVGTLAMVLIGCASEDAGTSGRCVTDPQCGDGICMSGSCLPRAISRRFAVEILPRADSSSALTEVPDATFGPTRTEFTAEHSVVAMGMTLDMEGNLFSSDGHLVFDVPSRIPGRPPVQIETELAYRMFTLGIPESFLGTESSVWLMPSAMNTTRPPARLVARIEIPTTLSLPRSTDLLSIRGNLRDALGVPMTGILARVTASGHLVSNVGATDSAGVFSLLAAPGNVRPSDVATLELTPPTPTSGGAPRLVCDKIALGDGVPLELTMPVFAPPMLIRFRVLAGEVNGQPVVGARVRFRTQIAATNGCTAIYEREALTDGTGEAAVQLVPGTATEERLYDIAVLPPTDSAYSVYGAKCIAGLPVTSGGSEDEPRYGPDLWLPRKVKLSGVVRAANGMASTAGVNVNAIRLASASTCTANESATAVVATTTRTGQYDLLLDPGIYRLDVEPPAGAPLPRLTLDGAAAVDAKTDTVKDIVLPPGEVVEGYVWAAPDTPLPSAAVHIFDGPCAVTDCGDPVPPPALRAQARTDANGLFRAVLPLP